jgi:hypothetical protein
MSIRKEASDWLKSIGENSAIPFRASKLYSAEASRTGAPAWWFEFSEDFLRSLNDEYIHLICKTNDPKMPFRRLRIPVKFFTKNMDGFAYRKDKDKLSLFVSAETGTLFRELRGSGKLDLGGFEVTTA